VQIPPARKARRHAACDVLSLARLITFRDVGPVRTIICLLTWTLMNAIRLCFLRTKRISASSPAVFCYLLCSCSFCWGFAFRA